MAASFFIRIWLGDRDSNPDTVVQSHVSCRWTIPQLFPKNLIQNFPALIGL